VCACIRVDEDEDEEDMLDAPPDEEDLKLDNAAFLAGDIDIYVYTRIYIDIYVYTRIYNAAFLAGDLDVYVYTYVWQKLWVGLSRT
jgi:hypothetical protein